MKLENNYLEHHGILGMKWGDRNGPPYPLSGSQRSSSEKKAALRSGENLSGRIRKSSSKTKRGKTVYLAKKTKNKNRLSQKEEGKALNTINNGINDISRSGRDIARSVSQIKKEKNRKTIDLTNISDQELRNRINRMRMEREYSDMINSEDVSKGRVYVENIIDIGGSVLGAVGGALGIALAIKRLKG